MKFILLIRQQSGSRHVKDLLYRSQRLALRRAMLAKWLIKKLRERNDCTFVLVYLSTFQSYSMQAQSPKGRHEQQHYSIEWRLREQNWSSLSTHTHPFNGPFFGSTQVSRTAGTRKVKRMWILVKQETVTGSGISRAICKSAPRSRQITTPAPHHSVFYRPYALPATQPTASKHWRQSLSITSKCIFCTVS